MDIDQDIKVAIAWNKFNLELLGIWPDTELKKSRLSKYKCWIPVFFILGFVTGPQTANLFPIWGDIDLVAENLATANIPCINALMKHLATWYHRRALRMVVASFYEDWQNPKTEGERRIMLNNANLGKRISVWCSILTQLMVTLYILFRASMIAGLNRNEARADHLVLYPGYFPYNVRPTPILILTCIGQTCAAYSATVSYTGVDSFISMLIVHVCGQIMILRKRIENLMGDGTTTKSRRQFRKELAWIVKRHEHLNWFIGTVENSFNTLLLIQLLLCTIQLCFQGFQAFNILLQHGEGYPVLQIMFFPVFVAAVLVHIYLFCHMGEMLLVQSAGLNDSAYQSEWFNVPSNEARCLLFIMRRSAVPLRLTAGKFSTFSMEMFSSILRTSMGYLSVLLTVANGSE